MPMVIGAARAAPLGLAMVRLASIGRLEGMTIPAPIPDTTSEEAASPVRLVGVPAIGLAMPRVWPLMSSGPFRVRVPATDGRA